MKKIILGIIIGIFLVALVTALTISNINKTITFTKEQSDALSKVNLNNYEVTDYQLGIEEVERCLKKENAINTCKKFKTYYNNCSLYNITEIEECILWDENGLECVEYNITEQKGECITLDKIYYTEQEIINISDNWEKERLKLIAGATISRENRQREIIREGVTEIK